jgi:hypothetical protein
LTELELTPSKNSRKYKDCAALPSLMARRGCVDKRNAERKLSCAEGKKVSDAAEMPLYNYVAVL